MTTTESAPSEQETPASREDSQPAQKLPHGLFAETVRQAPIAIAITDHKANIVYINKAFTEITGYAPADSIGRNQSMLSDRRTPRKVYEELWGHLAEQIPWRGMLLNRHQDGHPYLADLTIAPHHQPGGGNHPITSACTATSPRSTNCSSKWSTKKC